MTASGSRIHDLDVRAALCVLTHHHVARQQRPDLRLGLDRPVGKVRVAGAEDAVGWHLFAELLLKRVGHVDLGEDAEALVAQRSDDALDSPLEGKLY